MFLKSSKRMEYQKVPKVELHLHLDCCLSYDIVKRLRPSVSLREYHQTFIAPPKCKNLADYIRRAQRGVELMQTGEQLRMVTEDLFQQLKEDNVVYAEIRFAPLQHTAGGLKPHDVVQRVNDAVERAIGTTGIQAGVILCTLRHYSETQSMATAQLVKAFNGSHVVGFDIAADEAGFPIDNHVKAFEFAYANGIRCTAHAGEAKGSESVWETLKYLHPLRIGHGVRSVEDNSLLAYLRQKRIHLEICPTSNIQVDVFRTMHEHSIDKLFSAGVSLSINTDARTISNVTLSSEYKTLERTFHWSVSHFKTCNLEAIEHAFTNDNVKAAIRKQIEQHYA